MVGEAVAPDPVEDLATVHRVTAALDEEHEKIEVAGNERLLTSVAEEEAAAGRQNEFAEAITGH